MEPESGPVKTREAQAGLHLKLHGLDQGQAGQPDSSPQKERDPAEIGVQVQAGVQAWKVKTYSRTPC